MTQVSITQCSRMQISRVQTGITQIRRAQISTIQARSAQIRMTHVSITQNSTTQISITQISTAQISITQISTIQISRNQTSITQIRMTQISITQISISQISMIQIRRTQIFATNLDSNAWCQGFFRHNLSNNFSMKRADFIFFRINWSNKPTKPHSTTRPFMRFKGAMQSIFSAQFQRTLYNLYQTRVRRPILGFHMILNIIGRSTMSIRKPICNCCSLFDKAPQMISLFYSPMRLILGC